MTAGAFRRVVIALGASRESVARLATCAALARRLDVELAGLFVEDERVLHLAGFSFGRLIGTDSVARPFDAATVERMLRRAAHDARVALEATAARHAIPSSFSRVRGHVTREIAAAVTPADLLVVEAGVFAGERPSIEDIRASVLFLQPQVGGGRTVIVQPSGPDERLLAVAADLAVVTERTLEVVGDHERDPDGDLQSTLTRVAPGLARYRLHHGGDDRVRELVGRDRGAILVSRDLPEAAGPHGGSEPTTPECSTLVLRSGVGPRKDRRTP